MNTKKKIFFLVTQSEFGGAQRFIYTLICGLTRINTRINAENIAVGAGSEGDDENGLLYALEKQGIKTEHLKYLRRSINPFFDLLGLVEIYKLIKKEKPDILFLCSTKAGFLGSLANRINSKFKFQNSKLIYRIGGWTFNDPWSTWKKRLYIWLEKFSAKWKDYIINNAESDRQQAIKLGIKPKDRIITIYNGIDINNLIFLEKEKAREFLKLKKTDFVVGTIANNYPAKGIKYLIRAAGKFQNIKFVIIGKGNRFIPDAYKYLKAFDVFVLPSVKEGFPWTILEAMAAEVPVIATKVGAIPEIIKNNKSGLLVEPKIPEELAKAIQRLLENRNLREKFTKEARKVVEEKFSLDRMIKKVEKLLVSDTDKQRL